MYTVPIVIYYKKCYYNYRNKHKAHIKEREVVTMKINLYNGADREFHGISEEYAKHLQDNNMTIEYDEISDTYTIYDAEGNDQEILTFGELQSK